MRTSGGRRVSSQLNTAVHENVRPSIAALASRTASATAVRRAPSSPDRARAVCCRNVAARASEAADSAPSAAIAAGQRHQLPDIEDRRGNDQQRRRPGCPPARRARCRTGVWPGSFAGSCRRLPHENPDERRQVVQQLRRRANAIGERRDAPRIHRLDARAQPLLQRAAQARRASSGPWLAPATSTRPKPRPPSRSS